MNYVPQAALEESLEFIRQSPADQGVVELIVARPEKGEREVVQQAQLDAEQGMVGDNWLRRWNREKYSAERYQSMQITLMNSRVIDAISDGDKALWPLAGDQFFVDFDLSESNLPPGTLLQLDSAIVEVTAEPHLGCKQFKERYGRDAVMFVNSDTGKSINLRGVNAKVVVGGEVTSGGLISKVTTA